MKPVLKKLLQVILIFVLAGFSSCEKYFGDVNVNPNGSITATPEILLPTIEATLAYTIGGDISRHLSIFTNHFRGYGRCIFIDQYNPPASDLNKAWNHFYAFALMDIKALKQIAEQGQSPHYQAIAISLEAFTIMTMTDIWNAMPYSEALQGTQNLQPVYDNQQTIYDKIFELIDQSNVLFGQANPGRQPGSDDLIFNGDINHWKAFNNVLEARGYLHLCKRNPSNYQKALDALANGGFDSNNADGRFPFGNAEENASPWYQFNTQRSDMDVDYDYLDVLNAYNDPRIAIYGESIFTNPHPFFVIDQRYPLLSYTEQKFIEAECLFHADGAQAAYPVYLDAIKASFDEVDISEADYQTYIAQTSVSADQKTFSLNHIMTQKWIALFAQPEPFNDWRRTGLPLLTPNVGTEIARRLPYPQTEMDFNLNTPQDVSVFDFVWWDE